MNFIAPKIIFTAAVIFAMLTAGCNNGGSKQAAAKKTDTINSSVATHQPISQPLVSHIYTADPAVHVFNGRIYIYPSHDTATATGEKGDGNQFNMTDYHVLSVDTIGGPVTDHGVALDLKNISWAGGQLWAPDAAFANNRYYLYFPAKDKDNVFRIGVATSQKPEGPFVAEQAPLAGSYSTDPCVFKDDDGQFYMYFGGIWGGQLQQWNNNRYDSAAPLRTATEPAILPRVAKLQSNMTSFAEPVKELLLLDRDGKPFTEKDNDKRFFEGSWMHKYKGVYYFSWSTGNTHLICYATGASPYGPFTYRGVILNPVDGWTTHQSIVEINHKWYLFYHDVQLSGKTHLRNIKVTPLQYTNDGSIVPINPYY